MYNEMSLENYELICEAYRKRDDETSVERVKASSLKAGDLVWFNEPEIVDKIEIGADGSVDMVLRCSYRSLEFFSMYTAGKDEEILKCVK